MTDVFQTHCEMAKKALLRDGELLPVFFGYKSNGEMLILPLMMMGNTFEKQQESKRQILEVFAFMFHCEQVESYTLTHEAWYLVRESLEDRNKIQGSFEHVPDRREALVIGHITRKGKKMKMYEIVRKNNEIELKDTGMDNGEYSGEFTNLLEKYTTYPTEFELQMYEKLKSKYEMGKA